MSKRVMFLVMTGLLFQILVSCNGREQQPAKKSGEDIEQILSELTLEQKIKMLGGTGFDTPSIDSAGVPGLRMTDGPAGVRWGRATAFPSPVSYAASWDRDLVFRIGKAMAEEVKIKNKNVLLAPCVNIHRFPLGGRNFESYGEDPYLAAQTAVPFIKGIQSENVIATVKHFAANNQEWERFRVNTVVGERALREIYLPAFKAAVKEAGVYSVMAAYNKVNGYYCSENKHLLTDILKKEWNFNGYVVSDWGATHNTVAAANAGLDVEMPYGKHFGDSLLTAVKNGEVSTAVIDDKVRRILRVMQKTGLLDSTTAKKNTEPEKVYEAHKQLALEAACNSIVLLKNENRMLPLKKSSIKSIAVVGPNAAYPVSGGGGSSMVRPFYKVSPLQGIKRFAGDSIDVFYASGIAMDGDILPVENKFLFQDDKISNGLKGEYFKLDDFSVPPVFTRIDDEINFNFGYNAPESELEALDDGNRYAIRWTGYIKAPATGVYTFKVQCDGGARLFIDGKKLIDDMDNRDVKLRKADYPLKKGGLYKIKLEYVSWWSVSEIKLGWDIPGFDPVKAAAGLAKKADITIIVTGLNNHFESESGDLKRFTFPEQDDFINTVAAANPKTIVVMYNGSPYSIKNWAENVPAILEGWYGGQEQGNALAYVLFGKVNPSGKLPYSLWNDSTDCPAFKGYKSSKLISGYDEGIFVGYRYLEKNGIKPLYPFGHGLSYTTFDYKNMTVKQNGDTEITVSVTVENAGGTEGYEVVQIYVAAPGRKVERAVKELKGFGKLLLKPGETRTLTVELNADDFSYFDEKLNRWVIEPGTYTIMVGGSSADIRLEKSITL